MRREQDRAVKAPNADWRMGKSLWSLPTQAVLWFCGDSVGILGGFRGDPMVILCYHQPHLRPLPHGWRVLAPPDSNFQCREPNLLPWAPTLAPSQQSELSLSSRDRQKGRDRATAILSSSAKIAVCFWGYSFTWLFPEIAQKHLQKMSIYTHSKEFIEMSLVWWVSCLFLFRWSTQHCPQTPPFFHPHSTPSLPLLPQHPQAGSNNLHHAEVLSQWRDSFCLQKTFRKPSENQNCFSPPTSF